MSSLRLIGLAIALVVVAVLSFVAGRYSSSARTEESSTVRVEGSKESTLVRQQNRPHAVEFRDGVLQQVGPTEASQFVSLTLRGSWINKSSSSVTVFYDVVFLDGDGVQLDTDGRFRDLDANVTNVGPQVLATFNGRAEDRFDYRRLSSITLRHYLKGEDPAGATIIKNIKVQRSGT